MAGNSTGVGLRRYMGRKLCPTDELFLTKAKNVMIKTTTGAPGGANRIGTWCYNSFDDSVYFRAANATWVLVT